MNTIIKGIVAAAGLAVATSFASTGIALAEAPSTVVSVQPGDGSSIDTDATQGYVVGPLEVAQPQIKAVSAAQDRP